MTKGAIDPVAATLLLSTAQAVVVRVKVLVPGRGVHEDGLVIPRSRCLQDRPCREALHEAAGSHRRRGAGRLWAHIDGAWQELLQPLQAPARDRRAAAAPPQLALA